jgi:hypothetical protein
MAANNATSEANNGTLHNSDTLNSSDSNTINLWSLQWLYDSLNRSYIDTIAAYENTRRHLAAQTQPLSPRDSSISAACDALISFLWLTKSIIEHQPAIIGTQVTRCLVVKEEYQLKCCNEHSCMLEWRHYQWQVGRH